MPDKMSNNLYEIFADIVKNLHQKKPITEEMFYEFLTTSSDQFIPINERVKDGLLCPTSKLIIQHLPEESRYDAYIALHSNMNDAEERKCALEKAIESLPLIPDKAKHYDAAMAAYYRSSSGDGLKERALAAAVEAIPYLPVDRQKSAKALTQDYIDFLSIGTSSPEDDFHTIIELLKRTKSSGIRSSCERLAYNTLSEIEGKDNQIVAAKELYQLTESPATKQNLHLFWIDPSPAVHLVRRYKDILEELTPQSP